MGNNADSELKQAQPPRKAGTVYQPGRTQDAIRRAKLAVVRNTVFAAIVALGCVLIVLLVFNRPLVYRIFPWAEPSLGIEPGAGIEPSMQTGMSGPPAPQEGIYWVEYPNGPTMLVADPTLRPDLYVTIEFTYACGCQGSFIPAHEGQFEMYYPQKAKEQREKQICPKCQQALKYLEEKEKAENGGGK